MRHRTASAHTQRQICRGSRRGIRTRRTQTAQGARHSRNGARAHGRRRVLSRKPQRHRRQMGGRLRAKRGGDGKNLISLKDFLVALIKSKIGYAIKKGAYIMGKPTTDQQSGTTNVQQTGNGSRRSTRRNRRAGGLVLDWLANYFAGDTIRAYMSVFFPQNTSHKEIADVGVAAFKQLLESSESERELTPASWETITNQVVQILQNSTKHTATKASVGNDSSAEKNQGYMHWAVEKVSEVAKTAISVPEKVTAVWDIANVGKDNLLAPCVLLTTMFKIGGYAPVATTTESGCFADVVFDKIKAALSAEPRRDFSLDGACGKYYHEFNTTGKPDAILEIYAKCLVLVDIVLVDIQAQEQAEAQGQAQAQAHADESKMTEQLRNIWHTLCTGQYESPFTANENNELTSINIKAFAVLVDIANAYISHYYYDTYLETINLSPTTVKIDMNPVTEDDRETDTVVYDLRTQLSSNDSLNIADIVNELLNSTLMLQGRRPGGGVAQWHRQTSSRPVVVDTPKDSPCPYIPNIIRFYLPDANDQDSTIVHVMHTVFVRLGLGQLIQINNDKELVDILSVNKLTIFGTVSRNFRSLLHIAFYNIFRKRELRKKQDDLFMSIGALTILAKHPVEIPGAELGRGLKKIKDVAKAYAGKYAGPLNMWTVNRCVAEYNKNKSTDSTPFERFIHAMVVIDAFWGALGTTNCDESKALERIVQTYNTTYQKVFEINGETLQVDPQSFYTLVKITEEYAVSRMYEDLYAPLAAPSEAPN